ncbi:MAG: T9SS type A sorting domain-containing protein [Candidatus Eisenbacteria bacterium]
MRRALLLTLAIWMSAAVSPAAAQWQPLGLSLREVNRLQVHGGNLYACTNTGLYRIPLASTDTLWTFIAFPGQGVNDLAVLAPDTLLAAKALTGAASDTISIFRSTDGGTSWAPFQNGFGAASGREARRLLPFPSIPGAIVALGNRVAKSSNGGRTWRDVAGTGMLNALEQSPANPQLLWAGGENLSLSPYILKSTDAGESWTTLGMPFFGDNAVDGIAAHPTNPSIVFFGMEGRVMMSSDGGATWPNMTSPNPAIYTYGLAIRPFLPLEVYAAGYSTVPDPRGVVFFRSFDGGLSWTTFSYPSYAGLGVSQLLVRYEGAAETVYLATGNGVFRHQPITTGAPLSEAAPLVALRAAPNPFTGVAEIEFTLASRRRVSVRVADVRGRIVETLVNEVREAGPHRVVWEARRAAAGIYFVRIEDGEQARVAKVLHLR